MPLDGDAGAEAPEYSDSKELMQALASVTSVRPDTVPVVGKMHVFCEARALPTKPSHEAAMVAATMAALKNLFTSLSL